MIRKYSKFLLALFLWSVICSAYIGGCAEYRFSEDVDGIEDTANSVFMLEVYSSDHQQIAVGSGFVAFESNLLVTNDHVIEGGDYVIAISDEKERFLINNMVCEDREKDIAILLFDEDSKAQPLPLDETTVLKRAQSVVAIGSPAGLMNTVSVGNISAFYVRDDRDWIQFTAPISSGSSGGALFNDEGKIIGVTTATYASAQNINMAIRIKEVVDLYNQWDRHSVMKIGGSFTKVDADPAILSGAVEEGIVWVTRSGKKYHSNASCSGMKNPLEMDLLDAIEKGYEPCDKCYR